MLDFFSPSKESTTAISGTPFKTTNKRTQKSKKVVIEFPREWNNSNGDGEDIVGEPFHTIWDDHPRFRGHRQHQFWGPFILGTAVAFAVITIPSLAGIYWTCQHVPGIRKGEDSFCLNEGKSNALEPPKARFHQLSRWFRKRSEGNKSTNQPTMQFNDPTTCACQLLWQGLERFRLTGSENDPGSNSVCQFPLPGHSAEQDQMVIANASNSQKQSRHSEDEMHHKFRKAFTEPYIELSPSRSRLISLLTNKLKVLIPDLEERIQHVHWGGQRNGSPWYPPRIASAKINGKIATELEALDCGILCYGYLRVMNWPDDLFSHFPKKLCPNGCPAEEALRHTLEWREKFQPWIINPAMKEENAHGVVYHHGFSPPLDDDDEHEGAVHAIVWARPGFRNKQSDVTYVRTFMNTVERSVAASMERSKGRVGKFNFVLDASKFQLSALPSIHYIKVFVTMLQDHYPDRLGVVLMMNMSYVAELGTKLFLPLLSKEVREKLKVVPHDPVKRRKLLEAVLGAENIPVALGGTDTYEFQVDEYYSELEKELHATDEEAMEYLTTMPYHA